MVSLMLLGNITMMTSNAVPELTEMLPNRFCGRD
jgi:hypothetical protein